MSDGNLKMAHKELCINLSVVKPYSMIVQGSMLNSSYNVNEFEHFVDLQWD
jgi:hypothetical protein